MAKVNDGMRMLQCGECDAWVHFTCEKLPARVSKHNEDWASIAYQCPACRRCEPGEGLVLPARHSCGKCFSCDDAYLTRPPAASAAAARPTRRGKRKRSRSDPEDAEPAPAAPPAPAVGLTGSASGGACPHFSDNIFEPRRKLIFSSN